MTGGRGEFGLIKLINLLPSKPQEEGTVTIISSVLVQEPAGQGSAADSPGRTYHDGPDGAAPAEEDDSPW